MLDFNDIALEHEWLEGHELVDCRLIGIPVYRLVTDNIVLAKTPLSSLQSFVLRSIEIGMTNAEEISSSLGLDIATTQKVMGVLRWSGLFGQSEGRNKVYRDCDVMPSGRSYPWPVTGVEVR